MCAAWADKFEQEYAAATAADRIDPGLARAGIALFRALPETTDSRVLLCTELHGGNILAAQRAPWLVIDPKPYLGDPAYDVLQHMLNCEDRLAADLAGLPKRMADLAGIDADRVRRAYSPAVCGSASAMPGGTVVVTAAGRAAGARWTARASPLLRPSSPPGRPGQLRSRSSRRSNQGPCPPGNRQMPDTGGFVTEFELSAEGQGRISRAVPAPRVRRAKQVTRDTGAACGSRIADSRGRLTERRSSLARVPPRRRFAPGRANHTRAAAPARVPSARRPDPATHDQLAGHRGNDHATAR
jgi:Aminoglycoside/hydroxyurea antibiotic resistance kinase